MNQIYKLVYSKTLNQLVVVSEHAKRASASTGSSVENRTNHINQNSIKHLVFVLNKLVIGASLLMGLPAITTAASANAPSAPTGPQVQPATKLIEVDNDHSTSKLNVTNHNGLAVININDANSNGVSDNRFKKFSTERGAVFNNSLLSVDSTILGEKLDKNPNLKKAAEVILAQVTGNDKSVIKGALEIIGKKADLIIVNPNGIDLNGGTLVNVKDFTASTAEVNKDINQSLDLNVSKGEINVNGDLTTDDVNTIRLIANAIKLKATIAPSKDFQNSKKQKADIQFVAGSSKFNIKDKSVTAVDNSKKEQRIAISGAALGSMYGSKVSFEVTDSGAGIEFDGVVMGDDNISINAKGEISLNKVITEKDLSISTSTNVNFGKANASARLNPEIASSANDILNVGIAGDKTATGTTTSTTTNTATGSDTASTAGSTTGSPTVDATSGATTSTKSPTSGLVKAKNLKVTANQVTTKNVVVRGTESLNIEAKTDGKVSLISAEDESVFVGNNIKLSSSVITTAKDFKLSAKSFDLTVEGTSYLSGKVITDSTKVNARKVTATGLELASNKALFAVADELTLNTTSLTAGDLRFETGSTALNNSKVAADLLTTTYRSEKSLTKDANSSVTANDLDVQAVNKENRLMAADGNALTSLDKFVTQVNAKKKTLNLGEVNINANQAAELKNIDKLNVARTFNNQGVIDATNENHDKNLVVTAGNKFVNNGVLEADELSVKAAKQIDLTSATFAYQDLTLVSPKVYQSNGIVNVAKNLTALTDNYSVEAKIEGEIEPVTYNYEDLSNYVKNNWNNHQYNLKFNNIHATTNKIRLNGGFINVGTDLNISKLQGTEYAQDTDSANKTAEQANKEIRLDNTNGIIYAGGDINIDGHVNNVATGKRITVLDLLNTKSPVTLEWTPLAKWFGTKLWETKTQTFSSMREFLDSAFQLNDDDSIPKFSWNSGAYWIDSSRLMDTLKTITDEEMNKMLSAVFGADWKKKNYNELKEMYTAEVNRADSERSSVVIFNPGAQISAGGSYHQTGGDLNVGTNEESFLQKGSKRTASTVFRNDYDTNHVAYTVKAQQTQMNVDDLNAMRTLIEDGVNKNLYTYVNKTGEDPFENSDQLMMYYVTKDIKASGGKVYKATDNDLLELLKYRMYLEYGVQPDVKVLEDAIKAGKEGYTSIRTIKSLVQNKDGSFSYQIEAHNLLGNKKVLATGIYEDQTITNLKNAKLAEIQKNGSLPTEEIDQFSDKFNNKEAAAKLSAEGVLEVKDAKNINVAYSSLDATIAKLKAGKIKLYSYSSAQALTAKKTIISTDELDVTGVVSLGNADISAKTANFNAAQSYNNKGDLVSVGGASVSKLKAEIENDLTLRGFTFASTKDVDINVGGDLNMLADYDIASRYKSEELTHAYGQVRIYEASKNVVGSEIKVTEGNLSVKTGGDLKLESSKLQSLNDTTITVGGDLDASAKQDEYLSETIENRVEVNSHNQAKFGSAQISEDVYYASHDATVKTVTKGSSYTSTVSKTGSDAASSDFSIIIKSTVDKATALTAKNNALDGQNLTVKVEGNAEISNTDINVKTNKLAVQQSHSVEEYKEKTPTASIEATSITQENQVVDERHISHEESGLKFGVEAYVGGSLVDMASHLTSELRADSHGEKIDTVMTAIQAVGDVSGLLGRDAVKSGVRGSITYGKQSSTEEMVADSSSTFAGNIELTAKEDIHLKNVDGTRVDNLSLEAGNDVVIEGGKTEHHIEKESHQGGLTADLNLGVGLTRGLATGGVVSTNYQGSVANSESTKIQHTKFDADEVTIKAQNVKLDATEISGTTVDVEAKDKLEIISRQDTTKTDAKSWSAGVSVGLNTMGMIAPSSTSLSGGYSQKGEDSAITSTVAGLTATQSMNVKADTIDMVGGKIIAQDLDTDIKVEANNINAQELNDYSKVDGGGVKLGVGTSISSLVRVDIGASRDAHKDYQATVHSTIAGDKLDTESVTSKVTSGEINTVQYKNIEVTKDEKYQSTDTGITLDANVLSAFEKGLDAAVRATEYLKDTGSSVISDSSRYSSKTSLNNSSDGYLDTKSQLSNKNNEIDNNNGFRSANAEQATNFKTSISIRKDYIKGTYDDVEMLEKLEKDDAAKSASRNDAPATPTLDSSDLSIPEYNTVDIIEPNIDGSVSTSTDSDSQTTPTSTGSSDASVAGVASSGTGTGTGSGTGSGSGSSGTANSANGAAGNSRSPATSTTGVQLSGERASTSRETTRIVDEIKLSSTTDVDTVNAAKNQFANLPTGDSTDLNVTGSSGAAAGANQQGHTNAGATNGMQTGVDNGTSTISKPVANSDSSNNNHNTPNGLDSQGTKGSNSTTLSSSELDKIDNDINKISNAYIDGGSASTQNPGSTTGASGIVNSGVTSDSGLNSGNGGLVSGSGTSEDNKTTFDLANTSDESSTVESKTDSDADNTTVVNTQDQVNNVGTTSSTSDDNANYVPADGSGTSDGEVLDFSDKATAVVYSSGDLTCYVLTPKAKKTSAKLPKANSRTTIFSTYSKGIEELVGTEGVLCVSNIEKKKETTYNVLKGANDIPIVKSYQAVRATVVSNTNVERVVVRSNKSTSHQKVLRQVAEISVSEIQQVRTALRAKGIDASKLLFLGSKTSSAQGISSLINTMNTSVGNKADSVIKK